MVQAKLDYEVPPHLQRQFVFRTAGVLPPNGLHFGFRTIDRVGEQARHLGGTQALLVTDATMVQIGYADLVRETLEREGIKVDVFAKVDPEPHMETADALYEMVRQKNFDLVIGLGGGSSLDMSKLASVLATNEQRPMEIMREKKVSKPALRKILIPTTSGTGSEVSMFFVVSAGRDKYTMGTPFAFPEVAIVDPGLTLTMPPLVTAISGMDALTHAIESLMNKLATPFSDALGLKAVELIAQYLRRAMADGRDAEARYHMSMGSTMAMMSLSISGGLYAHSLSYALAMIRPLAHGMGCALSLPYTMAFNLQAVEGKLAMIARAMGEPIESIAPSAAAKRGVELVSELARDVKMPASLKEMGYARADLYPMAEACVTRYPRINNPRPMTREDCLSILEAMWEGEIQLKGEREKAQR